ncbi:MAG TPA: hypothetical protein VG738_09905 [Chitinophagaceae bacterium]|nr:hypothetical protein [Chitinophagaceae bacterium]
MAKLPDIRPYKLRGFLKFGRKNAKASPPGREGGKAMSLLAELNIQNIKKHISPFILFDWEFFSNELEFE